MKANTLRKNGLVIAGIIFVWWAWKSPAQDAASAAVSEPMPNGISEIVKLEQAHVSDNTIIAYVNNSGTSYSLDANQIIYLKQQGVSDTVLTALLTQPKADAPTADTSAPDTTSSASPSSIVTSLPADTSIINTTPAPDLTYVQPAPPAYYYPSCSYYYSPGYYSVTYGWRGRSCGWQGCEPGWRNACNDRWCGAGTWNCGGEWHGGGGWHH